MCWCVREGSVAPQRQFDVSVFSEACRGGGASKLVRAICRCCYSSGGDDDDNYTSGFLENR